MTNHPSVERPRPVPKGLRQSAHDTSVLPLVERPCPVLKGLKLTNHAELVRQHRGRKTLPCSKGIETYGVFGRFSLVYRRKTSPCFKGIETNHCLHKHCIAQVERLRPAPKGLKLICRFAVISVKKGRNTPPCSKGIEINQYQKYEG